MKKYNLTLALFLSVAALYGCKKEEIKNEKPNLIIDKKWKVVSVTENGKEIPMTQIPSCTKDNYMAFSANNLYTHDEGLTKCNSNDSQVQDEGLWSIEGDVLYIQSDKLPVKSSIFIKELTATKMVLNQTNVYNNTIDITTYITE